MLYKKLNKITLLDGGMGQELLSRSQRPITALWSADIMLNEPHIVRDLHKDFILSGARVITLNTYTATIERLTRENHIDKLSYLHASAIQAAKDAIDSAQIENVQIAACLPPLVASYRPDVCLPYAQAFDSYQRLVELQDDGCDMFLCETMAALSEASAACNAGMLSGKPVWVALTVSDTEPGRLRSGEPIKEAIDELGTIGAAAILFNCSQPESINASWSLLKSSKTPFGAYANGFVSVNELHPGGTVECLEARHDLSPINYAQHALSWAKAGASIIGGCCEISPAHILAIAKELNDCGYDLA